MTTGEGRADDPDRVTLRAAVEADALCIGVLGMQVYLDTYAIAGIRPSMAREVVAQFGTDAIRTLLAADGTRCIVAERDGHLAGFAQWFTDTTDPVVSAARPCKLNRLYVQAPFAGSGTGTALLRAAEVAALGEGADVLWLTTWVGNARALRFYPRRGYVDVGTTFYVFENERHENRVFARRLADARWGAAVAASATIVDSFRDAHRAS